jgi:hypothetical protein
VEKNPHKEEDSEGYNNGNKENIDNRGKSKRGCQSSYGRKKSTTKNEVIHMPKKITSMEQLKREAKDQWDGEFFILLKGNLRSSKRIVWDEEEKRFFIINFIDDSEQELTEAQLMDKGYTNIGYAMTKGALFKDD